MKGQNLKDQNYHPSIHPSIHPHKNIWKFNW